MNAKRLEAFLGAVDATSEGANHFRTLEEANRRGARIRGSIGGLYGCILWCEERGLVSTAQGMATRERGHHPRLLVRLTAAGRIALGDAEAWFSRQHARAR